MSILTKAQNLYLEGKFEDCLESIDSAPLRESESVDAMLLAGACLSKLGRRPAAIAQFEAVLLRDPHSYDALTRLANLHRTREGIARAKGCALEAVRLRPESPEGHGVLGACHMYLRDTADAIKEFEIAIDLAPRVPEYRHNLGLAYQMAQKRMLAIEALKTAIELAPQNPQSYLVLAKEYHWNSQTGEAIRCLLEGLKFAPNAHGLHSAIAAEYSSIRNEEMAEKHHLAAVKLSNSAQPAYAAWLINQGEFGRAADIYEAMLQRDPQDCLAYYGIMQTRKIASSDDPIVGRMVNVLSHGPLGSLSELHLRYALGKAFDQCRDFSRAIEHYDAANRLAYRIHNSANSENRGSVLENFERARARYIEMLSSNAAVSSRPIFIVGMIRSGTTLLEQIVSSHPMVAGAGELRFWIEEGFRLSFSDAPPTVRLVESLAKEYVGYAQLLTGPTPVFTDKMPINFPYLGLIARCIPQAKFIHIKRHPVDTCLSIYTTYFGQGPEFGYDRSNIVRYYQEYERIMAGWRDVLPPNSVFEVQYEDLIEQPGVVIPEIIRFCDLPWDESCLHHEANTATINTPSRWQARQPIYKSSLDKWKHYQPWLGEFAELLAGNVGPDGASLVSE